MKPKAVLIKVMKNSFWHIFFGAFWSILKEEEEGTSQSRILKPKAVFDQSYKKKKIRAFLFILKKTFSSKFFNIDWNAAKLICQNLISDLTFKLWKCYN